MPNMLTNTERNYDKPNKQTLTMRISPELIRHFTGRAEKELGGRGRTKLMENSMREGEQYAELVKNVIEAFESDEKLYELYLPSHETGHAPVWNCDGHRMSDMDAAALAYVKAAVHEKLSRDTVMLIG